MLCKVHKDGLHSAGTEFSLFKIFEELAVAAFLHKSLKGDFLHFHYHSSSLNKGCVCLTEDSLLVLKMTKEDFMTSSHLLKRQLKCSTWELLFQKLTIKVTRFWQDCIKNSEEILSACHATSMKLGKKANEKKKKKKYYLPTCSPLSSFLLFHKSCNFFLNWHCNCILDCVIWSVFLQKQLI